ncbi:MAG: imelysin family protein [Acidobacteriota bacterium]
MPSSPVPVARCRLLVLGSLLLATVTACSEPFPHEQLLADWTEEVILPLHGSLVEEVEKLRNATRSLAAEPSLETLNAARGAWKTTAVLWQEVALYRFDRMLLAHNQVSKRPPDVEFLEETVTAAPETLTAELVAGVGSLSKGLAAIEYLLFEPAGAEDWVEQAGEQPGRAAYVAAASEQLVTSAAAVRDRWLPEGGNYIDTFLNGDSETDGFRRSLGKVLNRVVAVLEESVREQLGRPLAAGGESARPERVEAPRSATSLALLRSRIAGIERVLLAQEGDGLRLADYADHLDAEVDGTALSTLLRNRFGSSLAALDAIPEPLTRSVVEDPDLVRAAYDELRELLVLIKVDLANQLGVTLTFNDNDGD